MQPSSLIFLVIIGIWVAYFVQYWVRRREHVATARSVDAFSESMRVLQRRPALPETNLSTPAPPSYAVSPARAVRPQVLVKRAEAAESAFVSPGVGLRGSAQGPDSPSLASSLPSGGSSSLPSPGRSLPMSQRATAPLHHRPMQPSRATRGIVLLVGALTTPVFALLGLVGVLVGWAFLVPLAMALGGFLWLRQGVQQEIAARRATRAARPIRRTSDLVVTEAAPSTEAARPAVRGSDLVADEVALADEVAPTTPSADHGSDLSVDEVAAAEPPAAPAAASAVPEVDEDDLPLTWDPVPVPRPTYTMKAKVERRPVVQSSDDTIAPVVEDEASGAAYDRLTGS